MLFEKIDSRPPNFFEKILLFMGIIAIGVGYYFVHLVMLGYGMASFETANALLLWFLCITLIILTAVSENSKEELKIIIKQQHDEMKLLRADLKRKR